MRPAAAAPWWLLCFPMRRFHGSCWASLSSARSLALVVSGSSPTPVPLLCPAVPHPLFHGSVQQFSLPWSSGDGVRSMVAAVRSAAAAPWWLLCILLRRSHGCCWASRSSARCLAVVVSVSYPSPVPWLCPAFPLPLYPGFVQQFSLPWASGSCVRSMVAAVRRAAAAPWWLLSILQRRIHGCAQRYPLPSRLGGPLVHLVLPNPIPPPRRTSPIPSPAPWMCSAVPPAPASQLCPAAPPAPAPCCYELLRPSVSQQRQFLGPGCVCRFSLPCALDMSCHSRTLVLSSSPPPGRTAAASGPWWQLRPTAAAPGWLLCIL